MLEENTEPKALTLGLAETFPVFILKRFEPSPRRLQKAAVYLVFLVQR